MSAQILVGVAERKNGSLTVEAKDGSEAVEPCVILDLEVIDSDSLEESVVEVIIPRSAGPELLMNLLTGDQWDALVNA
jgi:hypothetical protein